MTKVFLLTVVLVAVYMLFIVLAHSTHSDSVCEIPVVVEVLNGCGQPGMAERAASHLRACGFDVMCVGNADDFDFSETVVVDRSGDPDKAGEVAEALGRVPVVYQLSSAFFVDVTVVLGGDAEDSPWMRGDRGNPL
jgi:hypothetical protein